MTHHQCGEDDDCAAEGNPEGVDSHLAQARKIEIKAPMHQVVILPPAFYPHFQGFQERLPALTHFTGL